MFDRPIATIFHRVAARRTLSLLAGLLLVAALLVVAAPGGRADEGEDQGRQETPVVLSVTPDRLEVLRRPCLPTTLTVKFHNPSPHATFATALVRPDSPLRLYEGYGDPVSSTTETRDVISTYVPTDYDVDVPIGVYVPADAPTGEYELLVEAGRQRISVPVVVADPPNEPNPNLALGQETIASSTHSLFSPCGIVDGKHTYAGQGYQNAPTSWADATPGVFPDQLETRLAGPARIGRVDLYTHSESQFAIKDWDVQVLTSAGWQTVAQVRGQSSGLFSARFEPVTASAVRITILATNGYAYSTVVELEVYEE